MNANERIEAVLNVAVFTPIAWYYATGRQPPELLRAASLAYAGFLFLRDVRKLAGLPAPGVGDAVTVTAALKSRQTV